VDKWAGFTGHIGVASVRDTRDQQSQWPPLTEITNFKKKITVIY
jgi:hypothetical protein